MGRAVEKMRRQLEADVPFEDGVDSPKAGYRHRVETWKKVIGTIRKLESEEQDAYDALVAQKNELQDRYIALLEDRDALRRRLEKYQLAERMGNLGISPEAQTKLLGTEEESAA